MWFEGWWGDCCKVHDLAYDMGLDRAVADADLWSCVVQASTSPVGGLVGLGVGSLMYVGVRVFGGRFYKKAQENKLK